MATEIILRKLYSSFVPVDQVGLDSMLAIAPNSELKCVMTKPRNLPFLKKFFALLTVAFDGWDAPNLEYKGITVEKNKEKLRKDLTIMAGFGYPVVNINGDVRMEAKSISFANMDETEFEALYSAFINVILQKVLTNYTRDDLDEVVDKVLRFA